MDGHAEPVAGLFAFHGFDALGHLAHPGTAAHWGQCPKQQSECQGQLLGDVVPLHRAFDLLPGRQRAQGGNAQTGTLHLPEDAMLDQFERFSAQSCKAGRRGELRSGRRGHAPDFNLGIAQAVLANAHLILRHRLGCFDQAKAGNPDCEDWELHKFRRTYATGLVRHVDLRTAQKYLGHKRITSTERYLRAASAADGQEAVSKIDWTKPFYSAGSKEDKSAQGHQANCTAGLPNGREEKGDIAAVRDQNENTRRTADWRNGHDQGELRFDS